jgi:hypothetical protein
MIGDRAACIFVVVYKRRSLPCGPAILNKRA